MKKTLLIGSFISVGIAGVLFLSAILFATPVSAGILDGNWDCLPLPVCPPSSGGHSNNRNNYPRQQPIGRSVVATRAPTPTPVVIPPVVIPSTPVVTNTNTNTNTNTIYVNGGSGSGDSYPYPVYVQSPSYSYPSYSYPEYSYPSSVQPYYQQYQQPVYQNYYVAPLSVTCTANTAFAPVGTQVVWTARVSGGNGYYSYIWTGTEGLYGYGQSVAIGYRLPGLKEATVAVTSDGQSTRAICGPVNVGVPVYQPAPLPVQPPIYQPQYPTTPIIDIACYATPTKAKIGQPVTWTAQVLEAVPVARYSWTGTSGLDGSQPSVTKYYTSVGIKKATISVTLVDGRTAVRSCASGVSVSSTVAAATAMTQAPTFVYPPQTAQPVMDPYGVSAQAAAPFFSLNNVPWGWVAFLIILVLFITVIYLIFNRYKI